MKRVEKASIGGYAFTLESDAYQKLREYIDSLESFCSSQEGGREIMEGIEERIAELFVERCGNDGVVSSKDVEGVIATLGKPETIEGERASTPQGEVYSVKRRLFRNLDDKFIGGVCGGLGKYFDIDPVIIRGVWAALFCVCAFTLEEHSFWVLLPYLILWISMPAARSVEDKCRMNGENGKIGDIRRSVERGPQCASVGRFWAVCAKVIRVISSMMLIIGAFGGIVTGVVALLGLQFANVSLMEILWEELVNDFSWIVPMTEAVAPILLWKILGWMIFFLPFIAMLYGGIMLLFDIRPPKWHPGIVLFLLWIVTIIALVLAISISFLRVTV